MPSSQYKIILDMAPGLVDAEYTTDDHKEADELLEMAQNESLSVLP